MWAGLHSSGGSTGESVSCLVQLLEVAHTLWLIALSRNPITPTSVSIITSLILALLIPPSLIRSPLSLTRIYLKILYIFHLDILTWSHLQNLFCQVR